MHPYLSHLLTIKIRISYKDIYVELVLDIYIDESTQRPYLVTENQNRRFAIDIVHLLRPESIWNHGEITTMHGHNCLIAKLESVYQKG